MAGKAGLFRAMCQGRIQKPCDEQVVISSCHFKGHTCLKTDKTAWQKKVCMLDFGPGARHAQSCSVQVLCYLIYLLGRCRISMFSSGRWQGLSQLPRISAKMSVNLSHPSALRPGETQQGYSNLCWIFDDSDDF